MTDRLVVALTGSSAPQLGVACLRALADVAAVEVHLVISDGARRSLKLEAGVDASEVESMAKYCYAPDDIAAPIASGSFSTRGMIVIPCSMRTLAVVATGTGNDLIGRAADVTLKERRRLVLVARESPLSLIHIRNMEAVTLAGGVILPPVVAFYSHPATVDALLDQVVGKAFDQFGIDHDLFRRWGGSTPDAES
jgi:polyprenyl P-hydroxybenzoate/phenylacrylic acid decarboxylase-like protein